MKGAIWLTIGIFVYSMIGWGNTGINNNVLEKKKYKDALDAAANAAVKHKTYIDDKSLDGSSYGFGEGEYDKQNVYLDPDDSLKWFYEILYRNLGINDNLPLQLALKEYIPMKALVLFDHMVISDIKDDWTPPKEYIIHHGGKPYQFTLTNQVKNLETGQWVRDVDIGLTEDERKSMVVDFISNEINTFLNSRENKESNLVYNVSIGLNDYDPKLSTLNGVNFITLVEGIPISSINVFKPKEKFYSFSYGGSEIIRSISD